MRKSEQRSAYMQGFYDDLRDMSKEEFVANHPQFARTPGWYEDEKEKAESFGYDARAMKAAEINKRRKRIEQSRQYRGDIYQPDSLGADPFGR